MTTPHSSHIAQQRQLSTYTFMQALPILIDGPIASQYVADLLTLEAFMACISC